MIRGQSAKETQSADQIASRILDLNKAIDVPTGQKEASKVEDKTVDAANKTEKAVKGKEATVSSTTPNSPATDVN